MNLRNLAITGVIILALLAGYAALSQGGAMNGVTGQPAGKPEAISYSQLVQRVNAGEVLAAVQAQGLGIVDVSTREADLEDVFLSLTRGTT